ncbi:hypothetical protein BGZ95_009419 [Linnemannia exigua]|uniref:Swi5-dependent recombination DNA repair protein 1 n=1 Tax=Linnemannia exigua TaxID=604196 RepID=A0AAD4DDE2_9FUNG|nr:hypothetical protein BGZ95_009419 [Linnemannia exigua]
MSTEAPSSRAPNQSEKITTAMIGQKRPLLTSARLKGSLHKPFRSPFKTVQSTDVRLTTLTEGGTPAQVSRTLGTTATAPITKTTPIPASSSVMTPTSTPRTRLGLPKPSTSNAPGVGKRAPFRPPTFRSQHTTTSSDTEVGRLIQIQTLQARITQLQSSIRKGKQILKQQQKNETPIEVLTAKWKKASQEGAQVLMEKYMEQQSVFGGWDKDDDDNGPNDRRTAMDRGYCGFGSQQPTWNYSADAPMAGVSSLHELGPAGLQAMEEYIEHQDVQQDLPTVDEAIRSRSRPEATGITHLPAKMTKMQKLLFALGIDLDVIGYDPEQDIFVS